MLCGITVRYWGRKIVNEPFLHNYFASIFRTITVLQCTNASNTVHILLQILLQILLRTLFPHLVHPSRQEDQEQLLTPEKQSLQHLNS